MFEKGNYPIRSIASLKKISEFHSLRCDAKQFESRYRELDELIGGADYFFLGDLLPEPLVKGIQPIYIDSDDGIPVINTLSIQNLKINVKDCRYIAEEVYESILEARKLKKNDVLLTMDGGTSIGKPVLFEEEGEFTVDSHVAILRPKGITPRALVYLLASPIGQLQFNRSESGASGQTSVTEEDLRRFRFPQHVLSKIDEIASELDHKRHEIENEKEMLFQREIEAWNEFTEKCF